MMLYQDNETDFDDSESMYDEEINNQILDQIVEAFRQKFNLDPNFIRDTILLNLEDLQQAENILIQRSNLLG